MYNYQNTLEKSHNLEAFSIKENCRKLVLELGYQLVLLRSVFRKKTRIFIQFFTLFNI